ncbi:MAG TPA: hypothetical protein VM425_20655 [Myxococcota bacterium]|nr:hypothetical protein [Myxococcota bacterium]
MLKKHLESRKPEAGSVQDRRGFLKKISYIAPVIVTYSLNLSAAAQGTRGSPPDPPRSARVTRDGTEIKRR